MLNRHTNELRLNTSGSSTPAPEVDEEQLRSLWCGGLSDKVTEEVSDPRVTSPVV